MGLASPPPRARPWSLPLNLALLVCCRLASPPPSKLADPDRRVVQSGLGLFYPRAFPSILASVIARVTSARCRLSLLHVLQHFHQVYYLLHHTPDLRGILHYPLLIEPLETETLDRSLLIIGAPYGASRPFYPEVRHVMPPLSLPFHPAVYQ